MGNLNGICKRLDLSIVYHRRAKGSYPFLWNYWIPLKSERQGVIIPVIYLLVSLPGSNRFQTPYYIKSLVKLSKSQNKTKQNFVNARLIGVEEIRYRWRVRMHYIHFYNINKNFISKKLYLKSREWLRKWFSLEFWHPNLGVHRWICAYTITHKSTDIKNAHTWIHTQTLIHTAIYIQTCTQHTPHIHRNKNTYYKIILRINKRSRW